MASAKPGVHIVQLKPVVVPQFMIEGEKFVKWEEETNSRDPVTLRVDENGFYLYWTNLNQETDLLDISTIRDTRTSSSRSSHKLPNQPKTRNLLNFGSPTDTLEEKTLTVVTGPDFVNLFFFTFVAEKKETAKAWSTHLLSITSNLLQLNQPPLSFLKKIHTKLILSSPKIISTKNIIKTFTNNKEEKKRVEKALQDTLHLTPLPPEIPTATLPFYPTFFSLYKALTNNRQELRQVFEKFSKNKQHLTPEEFVDFINKEQRDPRLNEILYPYAGDEKARELIDAYEEDGKDGLSFDGFLKYLLSEDNAVVGYEKYDLSDDMDQPLCHYFINSSHNTYLMGHQLTGKSSVEMYRQALLAGCRCVELDFWNGGRNTAEEPVIVHGYTLVPDIPAKDVIEAIAESAFKTSDYPVILSFENHCNPKQQAKIAQYCREFFGDMLLEECIDGFPLTPGTPLPPPSLLKRKIIIKNKKKTYHHHHKHHHKHKNSSSKKEKSSPLKSADPPQTPSKTTHHHTHIHHGGKSPTTDDLTQPLVTAEEDTPLSSSSSSSSSEDEGEESSQASDTVIVPTATPKQTDKGTAGKESEAGAEISALVNYVQPVHFYSFEVSKARSLSHEMSSFDERQALTLLKQSPVEFVNYNKHQLSRVYPKGTRVDSANFMPQLFWNAGCQLVALNYQTMDLAMQLNMGIFELNRRSGYLLKPEFMRRKDRRFDPFAESTVDGIIAGSVTVKILSSQFLPSPRSLSLTTHSSSLILQQPSSANTAINATPNSTTTDPEEKATTTPHSSGHTPSIKSTSTSTSTYIELEMYGLPTDTVRKKFRTKLSPANVLNAIYTTDADNNTTFIFKKVVLPQLACLRFVAYEENGKFIGHRVVSVASGGLRPGYRHIVLRNESGQPLNLPTLFVYIKVKDYVPDGLSDFAEALANPIKYQNELEKRQKQLDVYEEATIPEEDELEGGFNQTPPVSPHYTTFSSSPAAGSASLPLTSNSPVIQSKPAWNVSLRKKTSHTHTAEDVSAENGKKLTKPDSIDNANSSGGLIAPPEKPGVLAVFLDGTAPADGSTAVGKKVTPFRIEPLETFLNHKSIKDKIGKCKSAKSSSFVKKMSKIDLTDTTQQPSCSSSSSTIPSPQVSQITPLLPPLVTSHLQKQLKTLSTLKQKESTQIMTWISSWRKEEYKRLSKLTKDKNELDRMKREVNNVFIQKGVQERERIEEYYESVEGRLKGGYDKIIEEDVLKGAVQAFLEARGGRVELDCSPSSSKGSAPQLLKFGSINK